MSKLSLFFAIFCLLADSLAWAQDRIVVSPKSETKRPVVLGSNNLEGSSLLKSLDNFKKDKSDPNFSFEKYRQNLRGLKSSRLSGGVDTGGGVGVLCRDSDGSQRVVTLDYFERMALDDYSLNYTHDTAKAHIENRLKSYFGTRGDLPHTKIKELSNILDWAHGSQSWNIDKFFEAKDHSNHEGGIEFRFQSEPLEATKDYGWIVTEYPEYFENGSCKLVQIAQFISDPKSYSKGTLKVDKNLFEQLDWFNKGILFIHEQAYRLNRAPGLSVAEWFNEGQRDSWTVRYFAFNFLYDAEPISLDRGLPKDLTQMQFCQNDDSGVVGYIYRHPTDPNLTFFNFLKIGHRYSIGNMVAIFVSEFGKKSIYEDITDSSKEIRVSTYFQYHVPLDANPEVVDMRIELQRRKKSDKFILNVLDQTHRKYLYRTKDLRCQPVE